MKVNEAPEKIHVLPNAHDRWFEGKIPSGLPNGLFVEYTRTDAFIEKACEFIKERLYFEDNAWHIEGEVTIKEKVIKDFRNYMGK